MDNLTAWIQAELQWAEPLRKRKKKILRKVFLIILIPFAGGALITPFAMQPYVSEPLEGLAYSVFLLLFALLLMLLILPVTLPQTTQGHFARKLRKSMARQVPGFSQTDAQDLLEALADPRRHFDYADKTQMDAPYHFILGRRYAFLSGGWTYTLVFLPLAGVRSFSSSQEKRAIGSEVIPLYYIWFDGLPKRDGFIFHDSQSRDRALAMLQNQLAGLL